MVYILIEESYRNSTWCNDILNGAIPELCKNKFRYVIKSDFDREDPEFNSFALILCSSINWAKSIALKCTNKGVRPILFANFGDHAPTVSVVHFDFYDSMKELHKYLLSKGKKNTAMFAVKNASPANRLMGKYFLEFFTNSTPDDIYIRETSISDCFESFVKNAEKYDSIICSNAHTAVFLVNKLRKTDLPIENILFISYGDSVLFSKSVPNSVVVSQPHITCGKTAVTVIKTLMRHPTIMNLMVSVECNIYESGKMLDSYKRVEGNSVEEQFDERLWDYKDTDISEITKIELYLRECTPIELTITDMIISKLTYEEIADICDLSTSTVKYHSKKMFQALGCSTRKEFELLLDKYNYKP